MSGLRPPARQAWSERYGFAVLVLLAALSLAAGIGLREPTPPDEPRFALAAKQMVESGQWLFPHRGSEIYAEKPPMFMWLQAAAYQLTGNLRIAFLLPSLLAALLTLGLVYDLGRRLWNRQAARYATLGLFATLQFGLQAGRAQIDMVLVGMTTLSLWALLRYLLLRRDWRTLALGTFAAGLGTVTKGVGFLPLLVFLPWLLVRRRDPLRGSGSGWHGLVGVLGFLAGTGVWLVPLLATVLSSHDPALQAYAREMLFKQTGTRYANAWHHVKPFWYYLQVMLSLWLPGVLLAPWLLPAWWRRLRQADPRHWLLLGWALLVLLFFSLSPGKRGVYVLPMLPALCLAAGPLLPELLQRAGVRRLLSAWLWLLGLLTLALGAVLLHGELAWVQEQMTRREMQVGDAARLGHALLALGGLVLVAAIWGRGKRLGPALVLATAALWTCHGLGIQPVLSEYGSAQKLMRDVGARIGPDAQLGMLAWREHNLLQADRPATDFGFKRPWHLQWAEAGPWLAADPDRRWLFVLEEAIGPCVDHERSVYAGTSNRRRWWLVPGTAWRPGCVTPPFETGADADAAGGDESE